MVRKTSNPSWRTGTNLVRGGTNRSEFAETNEAIFITSGYVYESAEQAQRAFKNQEDRYIYSRFSNPTVGMFEERMRLLEGTKSCRATATGMAAVWASLAAQLKAGDRLVASKALFGSCHVVCSEFLPKFGVESVMVDGTNLNEWEDALNKPTDVVFMETPSNPQMDLIDIEAVCSLAHKVGAKVVVDNVFATPILQKPIEFGADIVVYSATKHIDGQGRAMGGAILTNDVEFADGDLLQFLRHTGPSLSPFNAWTLLKGLETLELRMAQHCSNARKVAELLSNHTELSKVIYPGLKTHPQHNLYKKQMSDAGSIVCFELEGGIKQAFKVMNGFKLIDISNNLGDAKSLVTHPASTTHQRLSQEDRDAVGVTDGLVRISVGLEDIEDIIEDLDQALRI
ncbi:MAG TPA: O-succinylhomoserine sulfhydrylase [Rhodospirillales bacterium]|nr:O-succinylhomoserine sulfhydrylase [Rhodospirillales bacterium]